MNDLRASARRRAAFVFLCLALAPAALLAAAPPRLVVVISVDGLGWGRLAGYQDWYTGGLKRLLTEGQVETDCHYRHLNTETGPGHAALGTGFPPRFTGIV